MTARTLLAPRVADRLAKLCGLFGSDHDGERANAARLADQLIREPGLTWPDVIMVPASTTTNADWQETANWCRPHYRQFNAKELNFIRAMQTWREPSKRQIQWLADLYVRAGGGG
jgi:hypothetical protein